MQLCSFSASADLSLLSSGEQLFGIAVVRLTESDSRLSLWCKVNCCLLLFSLLVYLLEDELEELEEEGV